MALIKKLNELTPNFGKHCYFSEGAVIVGDVTMGDDCTVWFNAVIRGDVHFIKIGNIFFDLSYYFLLHWM